MPFPPAPFLDFGANYTKLKSIYFSHTHSLSLRVRVILLMADFEAPSFSLGLDLETQSEPRNPTRSTLDPSHQGDSSDNAGVRANCLDEVGQEEVMDSDPESGAEPTRVLKRLRRGVVRPGPALTNPPSSSVRTQQLERSSCGRNGDDDIEDFSSQEDLLVRGKK